MNAQHSQIKEYKIQQKLIGPYQNLTSHALFLILEKLGVKWFPWVNRVFLLSCDLENAFGMNFSIFKLKTNKYAHWSWATKE